jgi:hypothetical protein
VFKACQSARPKEKISVLVCRWGMVLAVLVAVSACAPAKPDPEMQKDIQAMKAEIAALKEKLSQVEASQKEILETLKGIKAPKEPAGLIPAPSPPAQAPLTVEQLLKDKDRLVNTRVTVKGEPGPILIHKKILYLQSPQGMVEVFFGNLADKKQLERLTAQAVEQPLTVTGLLTVSPGRGKEPMRLQIMAESVDF